MEEKTIKKEYIELMLEENYIEYISNQADKIKIRKEAYILKLIEKTINNGV